MSSYRTFHRRALAFAIGFLFTPAAAWGQGQSRPLATERDSANAPLWEIDWGAQIAQKESITVLDPVQALGASDSPNLSFYNIVGVTRVAESTWIIGQSTPPYLVRVEDGTVTATAGRAGRGPGEFRRLDWIASAGSGIIAFSSLDSKLAWFDTDLNHIKDRVLNQSAVVGLGYQPARTLVGRTDSGSLIGVAIRATGGQVPLGVNRRKVGILKLDSLGQPLGVLEALDGDEIAGLAGSQPNTTAVEPNPPLGKKLIVRVAGTSWFTLDTGTGMIERHNDRDIIDLRVRLRPQIESPTHALVDASLNRRLRDVDGDRRARFERNLRTIVSPGPPPVLATYEVDQLGRIWFWFDPVVVPSAEDMVGRFDPRDGSVATFRLSTRMLPLGADATRLWGVARDELDVERVYIYEVR